MNLRPSRAAAVLSVAVPLALASPLTAFAAGNSTPHGTGNSSFAVDGKTEDLTGQEWTQSGGKGVGDFPVAISSSGTSTVKGGYASSWTWSQLKTGWHYNAPLSR